MSIKITKQLAVKDDIAFGLGQVTQQRNVSGNGVEDVVYDEVNASHVPTSTGDVQADLDDRYTKAESDGKFPPVSNVLTKTNSVVYAPSNDYHPSTKKYVDDTVVSIGAGDMAKSIYDVGATGSVDNAHSLGTKLAADYQAKRGVVTSIDDLFALGYYSGTNVATSPVSGDILIEVVTESSLTMQKIYSAAVSGYYYRLHNGSSWLNWDRMLPDSEVTPGILPIGAITMFSGDLASLPSSWALCNGSNGTPNLVAKFIMGASGQGDLGSEGGTTVSSMPAHTHTATHNHTASSSTIGAHSHTATHDHTATSNSTGSHSHTYTSAVDTVDKLDAGGSSYNVAIDPSLRTTSSAGAHSHTITVATKSMNTGGDGSHAHTITVATKSMSTGSAGSPGDNRPPYYTLAYIQRIA